MKTPQGWLTLFHAVSIDASTDLPAWHRGWHKTYTVGMLLLNLERPWKVEALYQEPVMVPEETYEVEGFRGNALFPGGMILEDDGEVKIYYDAADTVVYLATCHVDELLDPF